MHLYIYNRSKYVTYTMQTIIVVSLNNKRSIMDINFIYLTFKYKVDIVIRFNRVYCVLGQVSVDDELKE